MLVSNNTTQHYLWDLSDTVYLIEAWAAWSRANSIRPQRCGSAERFYVAPSDIDVNPQPVINYCLADVMKVERAWRGLPDKHKRFLFLYYIKRRSHQRICQYLAIRNTPEILEAFHRDSILMIRNRLKCKGKNKLSDF